MAALWQSFLDAPDYTKESPWFPNPLICLRDMAITGTRETINRFPWDGVGAWLNGTWYWMSRAQYNDPSAILIPLLLALALTILRIFLNKMLFQRVPQWFKLTDEAAEKFPESVWKCVVYSVTWVWGLYLVAYEGETNTFFDLRSHWKNWGPSITISPGLYWLYMTQMGFYYHCIYATIYMETIRRDFAVLLTHHILTIGLLLFSYIIRFHLIGLLVVNFLDIGDVCLELSKCIFYFKDRNNQKNPGTETLANICFGIFTLQFILCRLYWYPTKVIYSAMHVSVLTYPGGPYYLLFNPMLWGLFAMQGYWFWFILRLVWKILYLGEDLEDNRDFKEQEEQERRLQKAMNGKKLN